MGSIRQAVILAGGKGERLRPLTDTTPKPLIPIHGKPFAAYLIELLKKEGIEEIVFLTGYLAEQFPQTLGDGSAFGVRLIYLQSDVEDDTGERLRKAKGSLDDTFLLLYGDNYWPLTLQAMYSHFKEKSTLASVCIYERNDPEKKNNMRVENGLVTLYDKTRSTENLTGVDIGFFILQKEVLDLLTGENPHFETSVVPTLIERKELAAFVTRQPYWGLTDMARLPSVEEALDPNRKVLFLDRDGTINKKPSPAEYVTSWSEFEFLPHAIDALQKLGGAGYELYIITNQPGIARGMMSSSDANELHTALSLQLAQNGITLSGLYLCPHGWDEGCACRKPAAGMLYQAAAERNIDLTKAVVVGDDPRDVEAGKAVGARTILVSSDVGIVGALGQLIVG